MPSAPPHRRSLPLSRGSLPQASLLPHHLLQQALGTGPTRHREAPRELQVQVHLLCLLGSLQMHMSRVYSPTLPSQGPVLCPLHSEPSTARTLPSDVTTAWMTQPTPSTLPRSAGVYAGMVPLGTTGTLTSLWLDWELRWSYLLCSLALLSSPLRLPLTSPLPSLGTLTRTCRTKPHRASPCRRLTQLVAQPTSCAPLSLRPTLPA